jgi:2,3-bisphosphoglycerate-dependent phosphoglycerate mutase
VGRLLLVRHAESEGNRNGRFTPHPEVPLTATGREQAREVALWLAGSYAPRVMVSSPFARARETADVLAAAFGLTVRIEPDLRERCYGALAGELYVTPRPGYDPAAYWVWKPPDGETLVEVAERAGAALDRIATAHPVDDVVVVSHGAVMLALWRHVTGTWEEPRVVPNAGVIEVEHRSGVYAAARRVGPDGEGAHPWRRQDPVA